MGNANCFRAGNGWPITFLDRLLQPKGGPNIEQLPSYREWANVSTFSNWPTYSRNWMPTVPISKPRSTKRPKQDGICLTQHSLLVNSHVFVLKNSLTTFLQAMGSNLDPVN